MNDKDIKQKTSSGIIASNAGDIQLNDYDTTEYEELLQDYINMRNGDSIASTSLEILKLPLLAIDFRIEGDNKELNEYVAFTLNNIRKGFNYFLRHILLSLDFGFLMFEKVWKKGYLYKGKPVNMLIALPPIQPTTIYSYIYDDNGRFEGIIHNKITPDGFSEYVTLKKDELFIMSWNEEFEDIRGRSLLRTSRLPWKSKQDIVIATTRSKVRGAGIPKITLKNTDERLIAKARTIGRTLANSKNAYVIQAEEEMNVELLQLQNQNDNVEFLQYLDRQQFFNTLTQFMVSGIGENGSRAATESHKSPYEIFLQNIANWINENITNELIKEIVDNSYFVVKENEYPIFKLNLPKSIDVKTVADSLQKLVIANGIKLDEQDEEYLRKLFGLPNLTKQKIKEREQDKQNEKQVIENNLHIHNPVEMELELSELNLTNMSTKGREIFELENAINVYNLIRKQTKEELEQLHKKILQDIGKQLDRSKGKKFELRYKREFLNKMKKLYRQSYIEGRTDAKKEIAKLKLQELENIVLSPDEINEDTRMLELKIEAYYNALDNQIKSLLLTTSTNNINKKGGYEKWILANFENINKGIRTNIETFTGSGYSKGRNDEFKENEDVELFEYTAVMDKNVCQNCAPYDGLVMTREELEQSNLNFPNTNNDLNPDCLGVLAGNRCRCQLIPIKVKESEL